MEQSFYFNQHFSLPKHCCCNVSTIIHMCLKKHRPTSRQCHQTACGHFKWGCGLQFVITPANLEGTYSRPEIRFPFWAFLHTSVMPPAWWVPTIITASCPANITMVWNTSVQITAFKPPLKIRKYNEVGRGDSVNTMLIKSQETSWSRLTRVVYNVQTKPSAITAPQRSSPVTM